MIGLHELQDEVIIKKVDKLTKLDVTNMIGVLYCVAEELFGYAIDDREVKMVISDYSVSAKDLVIILEDGSKATSLEVGKTMENKTIFTFTVIKDGKKTPKAMIVE